MTDIDYNIVAQGLRDQIERLTEWFEKASSNHAEDISTIGEALLDEAMRRQWCDEYDTLIANLNGTLHLPLAERERSYKIVERYTVTRVLRVMAASEEAAADHPLRATALDIDGFNNPDYADYTVRLDEVDIDDFA